MSKHTISAVILSTVASLGLTTQAHAQITVTLPGEYDSPIGYDYSSTFPPTTDQLIGTFSFAPVVPETTPNITISGSFGDLESPTTALSDYYLGYSGNEEAVEIEACDSYSANCASNEEGPTYWTAMLTPLEITDLAPGLAAGSLDFSYTWDAAAPAGPAVPVDFFGSPTPQYIDAGAATLQIAPEPATVLFCFSGLAGLAAFRRFRKL